MVQMMQMLPTTRSNHSLPLRLSQLSYNACRRCSTFGIAILAILLFVQSVAASYAGNGLPMDHVSMAMASSDVPCDHDGDGSCCDGDNPVGMACDEMPDCNTLDCGLRTITYIPAIALTNLPHLSLSISVPPDIGDWLLSVHDTPILRPPILV
jgi:hypothetical protein